jgi:hypothetical protein
LRAVRHVLWRLPLGRQLTSACGAEHHEQGKNRSP